MVIPRLVGEDRQFAALGPLRLSLLDRRGDVGFCYILAADETRRFGAVTRTLRTKRAERTELTQDWVLVAEEARAEFTVLWL